MPPLLCPSPILLDHSFPRNEQELRIASAALGAVSELLEGGTIHLVLPDVLGQLLDVFDCGEGDRPYALIQEIYGLLTQWLLQPHDGMVRVDTSDITTYDPHPIPDSCGEEGLVDVWREEVGKLLMLHDQVATDTNYFIGVACERAFAGSTIGQYRNPQSREFPLVGPQTVRALADGFEWVVGSDVHLLNVSFASARRNVKLLGAERIIPPKRGSHYKVIFPGQRSWPLDKNVDPQPDRFLAQLEDITGYPFDVIKWTLATGTAPTQRLRLQRLAS